MHVLFVEPRFPANQAEFVRGLKHVGATVTAIGETGRGALGEALGSQLVHYQQVSSVCDEEELLAAVRWIADRLPVDRLEATVEAHILPVARVREQCGIAGTTVRTATLCRDKPLMKEALRAAGVPCAASIGSSSSEEIRAFAADVGFPLILKPRSAAGAAGTYRVDDVGHLDALLPQLLRGGASLAVEEYIEGHEGFYDTLTVGGRVTADFVSHYYPNVIEAMRERWISPQLVTTNRVDTADAYAEVRELGRRVNAALGIDTSATHMEWFFGPKGLKFSEIGCRPPGVRTWDLYNSANDVDLYEEWANAVVHGRTVRRPSRRYAAGLIALRPEGDGQIAGYEGLEGVQHRYGEWIIDAHLPPAGTPTQPVEAGYMANAWIRMRHPDYDELRRMLDHVGATVKVRSR